MLFPHTSKIWLCFSRRTNMTRSVFGGVEVQVFLSNQKNLHGLFVFIQSWWKTKSDDQGCALPDLKMVSIVGSIPPLGCAGTEAPRYHTDCLHTNCPSGLYMNTIIMFVHFLYHQQFVMNIYLFRLSYLTWPTTSNLFSLKPLSQWTWLLCW